MSGSLNINTVPIAVRRLQTNSGANSVKVFDVSGMAMTITMAEINITSGQSRTRYAATAKNSSTYIRFEAYGAQSLMPKIK